MFEDSESGGSPQGGNLVVMPDGSKHYFAEGTTPDQMSKMLKLGPQARSSSPPPTTGMMSSGTGGQRSVLDPNSGGGQPENWVDKVRPYVAGGVGAGAAALTSLIPGVGETGIAQVAADTQSYALVDSLMKYLGASPPKSYSEALVDSEKDAAINAVAGKLMGTVFKGIKAFRNQGMSEVYSLAPTMSQALEARGMKALATVPRFLEDYGASASKAAALDNSGGKGFTQALAHANAMNGRMAGTNSNPQKLYDAIKGQLELGLDTVPEYQPVKMTQRTAPYQSVEFKPNTAKVQPIEINPNTARTQPIEIKSVNDRPAAPGMRTQTRVTGPREDINVPESYQTRTTGPVKDVDVPGSYQTIGKGMGEAKIPGSFKSEPVGGPIPSPDYPYSKLHIASQDALDTLANGSDHFKVLDDTIGDVNRLAKVLKVGSLTGSPAMNVKQDLAAYKFMDMVNKASKADLKGGRRFDPGKLAEMWNDPNMSKSFDLLYGQQGRENITEFFKNIATTQTGSPTTPLRYAGVGKFIMNIGALSHAVTTGNYVAPAGVAAVQIGAAAIGRMLNNPRTARTIVEMSKGVVSDKPGYASRLIGNALRNTTVGLVGGDGKVTNGSIVENPKTGMLEFQQE